MKDIRKTAEPAGAERDPSRIAELAMGAVLTLGLVFFVFVWARNAGGLWRDEIVTATVAAKPTWAAMAGALQYDSFPGLTHALLRVWGAAAGMNDAALRAFGAVVAIAMLAAAWVPARALGAQAPLLTLALFAWSPLAVRWMASLRAYGLGFLLAFVFIAALYRLVERPSRARIAVAAAVAILCVQCLYQNAFLVLAVCAGAAAVAVRRRSFKTCALVLAVGAVAAVSLLPYVGIVRGYEAFKEMLPTGITFARMQDVAATALQAAGGPMLWVWIGLLLIGIALAAAAQSRSMFAKLDSAARDRALYAGVVLVANLIGYTVYLKWIDLRTEPWYYLEPMAVSAVCLDVILAVALLRTSWLRAVRVALAIILVSLTAIKVNREVPVRQTNIDVLAAHLEKNAGPQDVIFVHPWFYGATFQRYYHGAAFWSTVPPHADIALQRLDLVREQMIRPDPMAPLLERAATALQSGNKVWLVGTLPGPDGPKRLPPAPNAPTGWLYVPYMMSWAGELSSFLRAHAQQGGMVPPLLDESVSGYEAPDLFVVSGWRP